MSKGGLAVAGSPPARRRPGLLFPPPGFLVPTAGQGDDLSERMPGTECAAEGRLGPHRGLFLRRAASGEGGGLLGLVPRTPFSLLSLSTQAFLQTQPAPPNPPPCTVI